MNVLPNHLDRSTAPRPGSTQACYKDAPEVPRPTHRRDEYRPAIPQRVGVPDPTVSESTNRHTLRHTYVTEKGQIRPNLVELEKAGGVSGGVHNSLKTN